MISQQVAIVAIQSWNCLNFKKIVCCSSYIAMFSFGLRYDFWNKAFDNPSWFAGGYMIMKSKLHNDIL